MDIFLYVIIFITGTFFGSFFTLAVYRIPRREDILIKHSYCPNCNNKLGFFDLFPVFSYIFLKGKCRYCGKSIRPRYLILEILSGLTFVITALSLNMNFNVMSDVVYLVFSLLYISILFIIAGIDKENRRIQKNVIIFGFIVEVLYIIYQCALKNINVYQYVIYLILLIIVLSLSNICLKFKKEEKYYIQILYLLLYMIIFCGSKLFIFTTIISLLMISIYSLTNKNKKITIGFFLCISNIIVIMISNILIKYLI